MIDFEPDIAKLSGAGRQVAVRRLLAAVQSGSTTPNTDAAKALGVHKSVMTQIRRHVREACGEGSELHRALEAGARKRTPRGVKPGRVTFEQQTAARRVAGVAGVVALIFQRRGLELVSGVRRRDDGWYYADVAKDGAPAGTRYAKHDGEHWTVLKEEPHSEAA